VVDPKKQALPVWQQNTLKRDIRTRRPLEVALMHGKRGRDWGLVFNLATETYFFHQFTHGVMQPQLVGKWYVHKTY
jgi:hypothetical protein